jgi:hypothetical protein
MCEAGITPTVITLTSLIDALRQGDQWQRAEEVLHQVGPLNVPFSFP